MYAVSPEKSTTVRSNHAPPRAARAALGALQTLSPPLAARVAQRIFTTPRRRVPRAWERSLLAGAVPFRLRAAGVEVHGARIGDGPAVLLVHGWSGGASQLAAFVPPLLAAGCSAVLFDGPAHGASAGRTATMPLLADAAGDVARRFRARAAVGHSLGGASIALALARGLALDAAVLVAPPSSGSGILEAFCGALELRGPTRAILRRRLERRAGVSVDDLDVPRLAPGLRTPALVVHDRADREVAFADGAAIVAAWPRARLVATEGLGHQRVLRDPAVVEEAVAFVIERLPRCGCGRYATVVVHGVRRCETCLLELHLANREERAAGAAP
jgi:hypothetical protein